MGRSNQSAARYGTMPPWTSRCRRLLRDVLSSTGWVDRTRGFARSLRRSTDHGDGLLLVGTPTHEPWHLAAHLDDESRYAGIPTLSPTLVRWSPPPGAPEHLAHRARPARGGAPRRDAVRRRARRPDRAAARAPGRRATHRARRCSRSTAATTTSQASRTTQLVVPSAGSTARRRALRASPCRCDWPASATSTSRSPRSPSTSCSTWCPRPRATRRSSPSAEQRGAPRAPRAARAARSTASRARPPRATGERPELPACARRRPLSHSHLVSDDP